MITDPEDGRKKKYRKYASEKQMVAIQLRAQGMKPVEAARKAGYSESSARTPKKIFTSQAIMTAVDKFKMELKDAGLTTEYMSNKFKEWFEKGNVLEQQNAYKLYKEIVLDSELKSKPQEGELKRRITLEEFIGSPTQAQQAPKQVENSPIEEEVIPHIADDYPNIQEAKTIEEKEVII